MKYEVSAKSFFENLLIQLKFGLMVILPILVILLIAMLTKTTFNPILLLVLLILILFRLLFNAYKTTKNSKNDYIELENNMLIQYFNGVRIESDLNMASEAVQVNLLGSKILILTINEKSFDLNCSAYSELILNEISVFLGNRFRSGNLLDFFKYAVK